MKCKTRRCKRNAGRRGLCGACYMVLYRMAKTGKTTWARLEAKGIALPANPGPTSELRRSVDRALSTKARGKTKKGDQP